MTVGDWHAPKAVTKGSHRQFKPGVVTVPGNLGDDIAIGTRGSVLKQAGLKL